MAITTAGQLRTEADDPGVAAQAVLRLAANVADVETITIGADVYELDRADDGVVAGRIAITGHGADTPAAAGAAIAEAINTLGTELVGAEVISDNEVLIYSTAEAGSDAPLGFGGTITLAETLSGGSNEWSAASLGGGRVAGLQPSAAISRVPTATEVALGNIHFVFPFDVGAATADVLITSSGIAKGWNGGIEIDGARVTLDNAGDADFATTDTITVIAFGE